VRIQLSRAILAVAISSAFGLGVALGQTQEPQQQQQTKKPEWKDRAEYDLVQSIDKTQDPKQKLTLLDQWRTKYPNTDFKQLRLEQYLNVYKQLNDAAKMLETTQEILKLDPKNLNGLYWTNLLIVSMNDTSPAKLDLGERAGNALLSNLDELFAPDKKPAGATDAAWRQARNDSLALAHRTLGWVAMQRKNTAEAITQFTADLQANPNDAQASYWLASMLRLDPTRMSEALFEFARAAAHDGPGAMDAAGRQQVKDYVSKIYTAYHGEDPDGLNQLLTAAKASALPPPDFKILSRQEVAEAREKRLEAEDPSLPLWVRLKNELKSAGGVQYFETGMKGALVPPENQPPFRGVIISQDGTRAARSVVVSILDKTTPEATLKFAAPMPGAPEPGTIIHFRGVASAFTQQPFMVTFEVERQNVAGWPAPEAPARRTKKRE
jgi:tetratricopeptide (TPR) repeat protein